ncbi:MAG: recombination-associated protein RdgC [Lentisphaerae bacterium]|nr:recombination-associated protein RdgC [Lentisphaerota bacterium]
MGFESGSVSFRLFYLSGPLPEDHVKRFAKHAAPPIDTLGRDPGQGWVTGRHLLDRNITEDTAYHGGYLRLALMRAERKIPGALLRAECIMEELAAKQAQGVEFLKRPERAKIRKEVTERLLPQMPPQLTGIPMICGRRGEAVCASAMSERQVELLMLQFHTATGVELIPLTPESAALKRKHHSVRDLPPTSFSPECPDDEAPAAIGLDFLTWLWFFSERRGGQFQTATGDMALALEGPLMFVMEGGGAHEARLRRGEPLLSAEAKAALMSGKKLRKARLIMAHDSQQWSAEFDGEDFSFRGVKLPKGEILDAISLFQERMLQIQTLAGGLLSLYDQFLEERIHPERWAATLREIRVWVSSRTGKR